MASLINVNSRSGYPERYVAKWRTLAFGQNAHICQALGVTGMLIRGIPLFAFGIENWVISFALWAIFIFSFLVLYVLGGHALIYGPHLFIYGFADLLTLPFRQTKTNDTASTITIDHAEQRTDNEGHKNLEE